MATKTSTTSSAEMARLIGVTSASLLRWRGEGWLEGCYEEGSGHGGGGVVLRWDVAQTFQRVLARAEQQAKAAAAERAGVAEVSESEARKKAADAELAELKLGRARGETISIQDHEAAVAMLIQSAKGRLLTVGPRLRARIGPEYAAMVEEEVHTALRILGGEDDALPNAS